MSLSLTAASQRMRAAIARDQTRHWGRLFWEKAPTKKELERREGMWFWWGSTGFQAEVAARTLSRQAQKDFSRGH